MIQLLILAVGALVAAVFQVHICPDEIRAWVPMVPYFGPTYAWVQSVFARTFSQSNSMITTPRSVSCCGAAGTCDGNGSRGSSSSIVG